MEISTYTIYSYVYEYNRSYLHTFEITRAKCCIVWLTHYQKICVFGPQKTIWQMNGKKGRTVQRRKKSEMMVKGALEKARASDYSCIHPYISPFSTCSVNKWSSNKWTPIPHSPPPPDCLTHSSISDSVLYTEFMTCTFRKEPYRLF